MFSADQFRQYMNDQKAMHAAELIAYFKRHDQDGDGYIAADELDGVILDLLKGVAPDREPDGAELAAFKTMLLKSFDINFDGKIDLDELSKILPTEANFLANFASRVTLSSVSFMHIWKNYDQDSSGSIEGAELEAFLLDLLTRDGQTVSAPRITDYSQSMLELFDSNKDGTIGIEEFAKILPLEENIFYQLRVDKLSAEDIDRIFTHYDSDNTGFIEGAELLALMRDLSQATGQNLPADQLEHLASSVSEAAHASNEGKLSRPELILFIIGNR